MSEFPSDPEKTLASQRNGRPEFYYDSALTTFWVKDGRSSWMRVTEGSVKARLKKLRRGGKARAAALSRDERSKQAKHAIGVRWEKRNASKNPVKSESPENNPQEAAQDTPGDEPKIYW